MTNSAKQYRPAQIWLHWIVVVGVILQIGFHEAIVAVVEARDAGQIPSDSDATWAWFHVSVGSIIMFAVIARLVMLQGHLLRKRGLLMRCMSLCTACFWRWLLPEC